MGTTPLDESLGQQFVRSLAAKDGASLKALMDRPVDLRAVTPGRCWECSDVDDVVDRVLLGTWFRPERTITAVDGLEIERVGAFERVRYRFQVDCPDGRFLVEQQAYVEGGAGRVSSIRLVCSGYVRW